MRKDSSTHRKPRPLWEGTPFRPLHHSEVDSLVDRILCHDEDDEALAFIALVGCLTYDDDMSSREYIGGLAIKRAFSFAPAGQEHENAFAIKAVESIKGGRKR